MQQEMITPLHLASREGHCDVVQLLLEKGAELNARTAVSIMYNYIYVYYMYMYGYVTIINRSHTI